MIVTLVAAAGCPHTEFPDEGPGQPADWNTGIAPEGSIGVCKEPLSKRPPIVNASLWEHIRRCDRNTPQRYMRLGYGRVDLPDDPAERRMTNILDALRAGIAEKDGNVRMLGMVRSVQHEVQKDERFTARLDRASHRTFACDYTYLFNTTDKQFHKLSNDPCAAYAYDPKERREVCLFDTNVREATWLTSAWGCLAFTNTIGEGHSCYRLCAYDDYCEGQVSCSAADFDLVLCAMGVCTADKVAGIL